MSPWGPLLVAGMHRSGTSLLARMLLQLGFDLGDEPLPADGGNPDGYHEDQGALAIHRRILLASVAETSSSWPDWGWSAAGGFDPAAACAAARPSAMAYLQRRARAAAARTAPWGWKDPRMTLLLPFWLELAPTARVIAIYRQPWDLVAALQRVRPPLFLSQPDWCLPLWEHYNRSLLAFLHHHPERCLLLNAQALATDPMQLPQLLLRRWGLRCPPADLASLVRPERLPCLPAGDPLAQLQLTIFPRVHALWQELQQRADLPWRADARLPEPAPFAATLQPGDLQISRPAAQPRVAVIVPTHNQGDLLLEALASVERQARRLGEGVIELQIVDDGSSEARSLEILSRLEQLGLRLHRQPNRGLPAARNAGLRTTTAPLVLPLDDDNLLLDGYLTPGLELMETQPGLAVLYGNRRDFGLIEQIFRPDVHQAADLWQMNRIDACALIRRPWIEACGGYDETFSALEDWDLWLGILRRGGRLGHLDQLCFAYRHRPDSMIRRLFASEASQRQLLDALRQKHGSRPDALAVAGPQIQPPTAADGHQSEPGGAWTPPG